MSYFSFLTLHPKPKFQLDARNAYLIVYISSKQFHKFGSKNILINYEKSRMYRIFHSSYL